MMMTPGMAHTLIRKLDVALPSFTGRRRPVHLRSRSLAFHPLDALISYGRMRKTRAWCILALPVPRREASEFWSACALRAAYLSMQTPSTVLVENLPVIERIIRGLCRGTMDASQMEEFSGFVRLRLIEHDYAILCAFEGRSSLGTYLNIVVTRLLNDYRNHEWGKWHDSAEAKRQGDLGVDLERLVMRDMRSFDEALITLKRKYPGITKAMLEQLAARFPQRQRRRMVGLDQRPEPSVADTGDSLANAQMAALVSSVIREFIEQLPREDQLLFQLRFEGGMPVPQIATSLKKDAQSLYRRLRAHFGDLRRKLEAAGVDAGDAERLMTSDSVLDFKRKSGGRRPSNDEDPGGMPEGGA